MLSVQKLYNYYLYDGIALDKSKHTAHFFLALLSVTAVVLLIKSPMQMEILDLKKVSSILPEVIIQKQVEKSDKKKFEILFVKDSDFVYPQKVVEEKAIVKKIIEEPIVKEIPKEIKKPEPVKTKPVKKVAPVKKEAIKKEENIVSSAKTESTSSDTKSTASFSSKGSSQASDSALSQLLTIANKYKVYPKNARRSGIEGTNYILVNIDKTGKVVKAELATQSGKRLLDVASGKLSSKLINAQLSGVNTAMQVRIPISYTMHD